MSGSRSAATDQAVNFGGQESIHYRPGGFDYPAAVIERELRDVGLGLFDPA